ISSRNCSRFDFRPYFSKPVCAARVCCRNRVFLRLTHYPRRLWIREYFRGSLGDGTVPGTHTSLRLSLTWRLPALVLFEFSRHYDPLATWTRNALYVDVASGSCPEVGFWEAVSFDVVRG